ncbi:MAG TPA: hypothetical protein VHC63_10715 [Acidimicrobiales bacterium]|nr:hypothetical protein [Acidimicrobiales bacterium]
MTEIPRPKLTALDEGLCHQIPEPFPTPFTDHPHWRESLFFIVHNPERLDDVVILTLASFPTRGEMDALQLGRIGDAHTWGRHVRHLGDDPHALVAGPVKIDIVEPFKTVQLHVDEDPAAPVALDLTFSARTPHYALRRGTMKYRDETIWDQSHMIQSGWFNGTVRHQGRDIELKNWWGQRDHSWGIRDHARCPMWMWLAIQLPDGMIGVWNWEMPDGSLVFRDGAFCPADGGAPVPLTDFSYDLDWIDESGNAVSYERDGEQVTGIAGHVDFAFEDGQKVAIDTTAGRWAQRYGPVGGGLSEVSVETSDGRVGTAIYECTGAYHHHFFPVRRSDNLPGD